MPSRAAVIGKFSRDNVQPFSDAEIEDGNFADMFRPKPTPRPLLADWAQLRRYGNIGEFVGFLDDYLSKFEFAEESMETWEAEYIFPTRAARRRYQRANAGLGLSQNDVINKSPAFVLGWIKETILHPLRSDEYTKKHFLVLLLGDIGSGKSTFNKYVTNYFFREFQNNEIVTSRIEFRKLSKRYDTQLQNTSARNSPTSGANILNTHIAACLIRDLFFSLYTDIQPCVDGRRLRPTEHARYSQLSLDDRAVLNDLKDFVRRNTHEQEHEQLIADVIHEIGRAKHEFTNKNMDQRTLWFASLQSRERAQRALEFYLRFAYEKGIRFYLIFDGFDFVQASDYVQNSPHADVLDAVSKWTFDQRGRVTLQGAGLEIRVLTQMTMRTCTYSMFFRSYSRAFNNSNSTTFHVAPPHLYRRLFQSDLQSKRYTYSGYGRRIRRRPGRVISKRSNRASPRTRAFIGGRFCNFLG